MDGSLNKIDKRFVSVLCSMGYKGGHIFDPREMFFITLSQQ